MRRTLFLLLAFPLAAAAQDVFLELHSDPVEPFFGNTALSEGSADSVTVTSAEALDMTPERRGMVTIVGAANYDWEYEDNSVGSVLVDVRLHSTQASVQVRGVEDIVTQENADVNVSVSSQGMPFYSGSTAAYFTTDDLGERTMNSATLSLENAVLRRRSQWATDSTVATVYCDGGDVESLTIGKVKLNMRNVTLSDVAVAPIIVSNGAWGTFNTLHVDSIDINLAKGDYATVYADGQFNADDIDDLSLGGSTVTLTHQAHVGTLTATALESANVVLNGGSIADSDIAIDHADIIGGVNKLTPAVETLTIDGHVTLRDKVTVNDSYEVAEGSHINAIGMGTENGYACVTAGTAYQLIAGKGTPGDISGATASYGDIQGKLETRGDGVYVTFDAPETGNVYYVLNKTDAEAVANGMRPDAQHMALLAELEMNTSLSVADIAVTDAGAMVFKGENPTCKLDTQLTLEDGAQLVFDFTPSKLDTNTPLLTYTGGSINHSGTTLITLKVSENWEQGCTDVYELATGLGSLGNVHINVSPADRDTVTYLGAAYIHNGTLYYGNIPEPATATLSLLALAGLTSRRRRK